jgi:hypothetical protein
MSGLPQARDRRKHHHETAMGIFEHANGKGETVKARLPSGFRCHSATRPSTRFEGRLVTAETRDHRLQKSIGIKVVEI